MYLCDEGFVVSDDQVRTCSSNGVSVLGVWTELATQCLRKLTTFFI